MMYKCRICLVVSAPGEPLRRFTRYHVVAGLKQIASEIPVCGKCDGHLKGGEKMDDLVRYESPVVKVVSAPPSVKTPSGEAKTPAKGSVLIVRCGGCGKLAPHERGTCRLCGQKSPGRKR